MRLFKDYAFCGINFFTDKLELSTAVGRKKLRSLTVAVEVDEIISRLKIADDFYQFLLEDQNVFRKLRHELSRCKDISTTLTRLVMRETLDDVELFEIKELAFLINDLQVVFNNNLEKYCPLRADEVIRILDPERFNVPSFFIYDAYDSELRTLRNSSRNFSNERTIIEAQRIEEIEQRIRIDLSEQLHNYASLLIDALEKIAVIDLETAKAELAQTLQLTLPLIGAAGIKLRGAFNAEVRDCLQASGRVYQPVDIELFTGVALLTGANMSGKSVLLKLVASVQLLFQVGFFVPAQYAELQPVAEVFLLCGDMQSANSGLSSYAAEMLYADDAVKFSRQNQALVLFDELARSTNPHEGRAIVAAIAEILAESQSVSLITTHYSSVNSAVRRLRVKGIRDVEIPAGVDINKLGNYIDYAIVEQDSEQCPEEALRIAELIGVSREIIERAKKLL
ncbi:MAG: hypothetical protein WCV63_00705 [Negativicutes bacterium]|jgi:DNA mismatch repair ATPase MutS